MAAVGRIRDRRLTLVLMSMFAQSLIGQVATGYTEYQAERQEHGQTAVSVNSAAFPFVLVLAFTLSFSRAAAQQHP